MKQISLIPDEAGIRLDRLAQQEGIFLHAPCGGNHTCGKCKVHVSGALDAPTAEELRFLSPEERRSGIRLACFAHVMGPVSLRLESTENQQILSDAAAVADADPSVQGECGAAIDIGTTTVVCALYRSDGTLLGTESRINCQQSYGADVISRIQKTSEVGLEALHRLILAQLEEMLATLCHRYEVDRRSLRRAVVTGNTTMLHFFAGLDPSGIGVAPYTPQSLFDTVEEGLLEGISVYLPPCISAYVGADTVCCLLFSKLTERRERALLIDIGTNGEMALFADGTLTCCSTAAGPAFEGSGITFGSIAKPGAIVAVRGDRERHTLSYTTIDGQPACCICGSGVIEGIAAMRLMSLLDVSGRMEGEHPYFRRFFRRMENGDLAFFFPQSAVALTQRDVRQIQLAKAAIAAGAETLLQRSGADFSQIDRLYLCGGFGSSLNCTAAEQIGLIPPGTAAKVNVLGNAALKGAAAVLLREKSRQQLREIARRCRYIELSTDLNFTEHYIFHMNFPPLP